MPILDIAGAYCPQGCGQTLHVMASGMIQCLGKGCPDSGTAQKLLADQEYDDIVQVREDGFTVTHPLRERIQPGGLLACAVHEKLASIGDLPAPGRYRAVVISGILHFTLIP